MAITDDDPIFTYEVEGTAVDGCTWRVTGEVDSLATDFMLIIERAMQSVFNQLTQGKAVYGQPGKGCQGPYKITKLLLQKGAR